MTIKKLIWAIGALVIALASLIQLQPSEFRVSRSAEVAATPDKVFPFVADFRSWEKWSPWARIDPAMKVTLEGEAATVGSFYEWSGNDQAGSGRMTLKEVTPPERLMIDLTFTKPMAATNKTEFLFETTAAGTRVTWTMSGTNGFISKAFWLFFGIAGQLAQEFDKGLATLKALAEAP